MTVVGLTGQSGSGKSTLAKRLEEFGYIHIDCDRLAREAVSRGTECLKELTEAVGDGILMPDGELNRRKLAKIAFADKSKLETLNKITHKHIKLILENRLCELKNSGYIGCIVDAPTLFEAGVDSLCDVKVAVLAKLEARVERIMKRDGISHDEAITRCNAQHDDGFYAERCDYVIRNDGDDKTYNKAIDNLALELSKHNILPKGLT